MAFDMTGVTENKDSYTLKFSAELCFSKSLLKDEKALKKLVWYLIREELFVEKGLLPE
jgi:hypothetical protein